MLNSFQIAVTELIPRISPPVYSRGCSRNGYICEQVGMKKNMVKKRRLRSRCTSRMWSFFRLFLPPRKSHRRVGRFFCLQSYFFIASYKWRRFDSAALFYKVLRTNTLTGAAYWVLGCGVNCDRCAAVCRPSSVARDEGKVFTSFSCPDRIFRVCRYVMQECCLQSSPCAKSFDVGYTGYGTAPRAH